MNGRRGSDRDRGGKGGRARGGEGEEEEGEGEGEEEGISLSPPSPPPLLLPLSPLTSLLTLSSSHPLLPALSLQRERTRWLHDIGTAPALLLPARPENSTNLCTCSLSDLARP